MPICTETTIHNLSNQLKDADAKIAGLRLLLHDVKQVLEKVEAKGNVEIAKGVTRCSICGWCNGSHFSRCLIPEVTRLIATMLPSGRAEP